MARWVSCPHCRKDVEVESLSKESSTPSESGKLERCLLHARLDCPSCKLVDWDKAEESITKVVGEQLRQKAKEDHQTVAKAIFSEEPLVRSGKQVSKEEEMVDVVREGFKFPPSSPTPATGSRSLGEILEECYEVLVEIHDRLVLLNDPIILERDLKHAYLNSSSSSTETPSGEAKQSP